MTVAITLSIVYTGNYMPISDGSTRIVVKTAVFHLYLSNPYKEVTHDPARQYGKSRLFPLACFSYRPDRYHDHRPHGGRILDPCAGEGMALAALARARRLDPFGVELHELQAQTARQQIQALLA